MRSVALVTGAAGDLGAASAVALARAGFAVVMTDLNSDAVQRLCDSLPGDGHSAFALDVTSEMSVADVFGRVEEQVGPVSVLAHLAGIIDGAGPMNGILVADLDMAVWDKVFAVNALGTFLCVREMVRRRRHLAVEHGRIIAFSSLAGQMGGYVAGAAYAASKAAIIGFTKNIAREIAPLGITANVVAPGAIDSSMNRLAIGAPRESPAGNSAGVGTIPMGRKGTSSEVADLVAFLASPQAAYITGQTLAINGGSYM